MSGAKRAACFSHLFSFLFIREKYLERKTQCGGVLHALSGARLHRKLRSIGKIKRVRAD